MPSMTTGTVRVGPIGNSEQPARAAPAVPTSATATPERHGAESSQAGTTVTVEASVGCLKMSRTSRGTACIVQTSLLVWVARAIW